MINSSSPAPFVKWAGGKRKLLPLLKAASPKSYKAVIEPFVGGGAFILNTDLSGKKALINDVNSELTNTYIIVRDDVSSLIDELKKLSKDLSKEEFLRIRALDPKVDFASDPVGRAARLIYLNKTCFNGLWRENSKGQFNVPWGQRAKVNLCDEASLKATSKHLQNVSVENLPVASLFNKLISQVGVKGTIGDDMIKPGTLVYLDPPYIPLTETASFSQYSKDGFSSYDQLGLSLIIEELISYGVDVMFSNSNTIMTREIFSSLDLMPISAPRSISASAGSRGDVKEVLGVSYERSSMTDPSIFTTLTHPNVAVKKDNDG